MLNPLTLPPLLSLPGRLVPLWLHSRVLAGTLNQVLAAKLADGELVMLDGRTLGIVIRDAGVQYRLTLEGGRLAGAEGVPDVVLNGELHAFLLMLARREDPDTLFFHRRLAIEGDTALGLELKNFLDRLEWETLPLPALLDQLPQQALRAFETVVPLLDSLAARGRPMEKAAPARD